MERHGGQHAPGPHGPHSSQAQPLTCSPGHQELPITAHSAAGGQHKLHTSAFAPAVLRAHVIALPVERGGVHFLQQVYTERMAQSKAQHTTAARGRRHGQPETSSGAARPRLPAACVHHTVTHRKCSHPHRQHSSSSLTWKNSSRICSKVHSAGL